MSINIPEDVLYNNEKYILQYFTEYGVRKMYLDRVKLYNKEFEKLVTKKDLSIEQKQDTLSKIETDIALKLLETEDEKQSKIMQAQNSLTGDALAAVIKNINTETRQKTVQLNNYLKAQTKKLNREIALINKNFPKKSLNATYYRRLRLKAVENVAIRPTENRPTGTVLSSDYPKADLPW